MKNSCIFEGSNNKKFIKMDNQKTNEISNETKLLIEKLQKEVNEFSENVKDKIYEICESMNYKNSSKFSYNIDLLEQFTKKINEEI